MPRYDVVLLDADMTLLDFARSERAALGRVLEQYGLPRDERVCADYTKINAALWEALARGEVDQDFLVVERFAALLRIYGQGQDPRAVNRDYERSLGEEAFLLPGAMEFCKALKAAGLTLAIATNGLPAAQRGRHTRTGLDRVIPDIFISMEVGASKPRREYFDRVLSALGVADRSRVVMIGDSLSSDIAGAANAGLDSIWFNPEHRENHSAVVPTWEAGSYGEILELLGEAETVTQM